MWRLDDSSLLPHVRHLSRIQGDPGEDGEFGTIRYASDGCESSTCSDDGIRFRGMNHGFCCLYSSSFCVALSLSLESISQHLSLFLSLPIYISLIRNYHENLTNRAHSFLKFRVHEEKSAQKVEVFSMVLLVRMGMSLFFEGGTSSEEEARCLSISPPSPAARRRRRLRQ